MADMAVGRRTRRDFLRRVGQAGGAGALLATMGALDLALTSDSPVQPFQPPHKSDLNLTGRSAKSVVILGAGVAGLACAYELGKAGYACTVLEAQDRVGGRNLTVRGGTKHTDLDGKAQTAAFAPGQYLNAGPARIAQWMITMDYCRELGVPLEMFANVNSDAYFYQESAGMTAGHPVRRRQVKADMFGYISELLAKATDKGALDQLMTDDDKDSLLDFLTQFGNIGKRIPGNPGASFAYTGGPQRGYTTWPGAAGTPGVVAGPPPSLATVFAYEVGEELSFETDFEQAMVMMQPVGGMDAIPEAFAKAIGAPKIQLGCPVTGITNGPDRVSVTYHDASGQEKQLETDFCIATLPPNVLARIPHNLGPDVTRALTSYKQERVDKIGLEYRTRWWETDHRIYGGITETDLDLEQVWYPSHGFGTPTGVLLGYYNTGDDADVYTRLSTAAREARAIEQGIKIHGPKYRSELASSFSIAWSRAPFIEGGWQDIPGGPDAPIYAPLNNGVGRVYFAGDWLSYMVSWMHGAFTSAQKTVTALHSRAAAT
jgi:monoamine oxidase